MDEESGTGSEAGRRLAIPSEAVGPGLLHLVLKLIKLLSPVWKECGFLLKFGRASERKMSM